MDLPERLGHVTGGELAAMDDSRVSPDGVEEYLVSGIDPRNIRWVTA